MIENLRQIFTYNPETGAITRRSTGRPAFVTRHCKGYLVGYALGRNFLAHRVAYALFHGEWPNLIDHANGVKTDNRIENLRSVDTRANAMNQKLRKDSSTGFVGVSLHKASGLYQAYVFSYGRKTSLGYHKTAEDAAARRRIASFEMGFSDRHGTSS
jgi:hypothetical protein